MSLHLAHSSCPACTLQQAPLVHPNPSAPTTLLNGGQVPSLLLQVCTGSPPPEERPHAALKATPSMLPCGLVGLGLPAPGPLHVLLGMDAPSSTSARLGPLLLAEVRHPDPGLTVPTAPYNSTCSPVHCPSPPGRKLHKVLSPLPTAGLGPLDVPNNGVLGSKCHHVLGVLASVTLSP